MGEIDAEGFDRTVEVPVRNLTSVMFGGRNLDVMYVTSMGQPMKGIPRTWRVAGCAARGGSDGPRSAPLA